MNEQAEASVKEMEESKRKLEDLTKEELIQLVSNPTDKDRELLVEYIFMVDTESFNFNPLNEDERLEYDFVEHIYFKGTNERIDTNEIVIYRVSTNGDREEIKRFNRAGRIIEEPHNTKGHFFFYIKDDRDRYDEYLWEIDASKGIGRIISNEWGFVAVSKNSKYFIKQVFPEHTYNDDKFIFPVLSVYTYPEMVKTKEYDILNLLVNEFDREYLLEESFAFHVKSLNNKFIAELNFMGDKVHEFRIDQTTLEMSRIE
jgi:hypothetical protein